MEQEKIMNIAIIVMVIISIIIGLIIKFMFFPNGIEISLTNILLIAILSMLAYLVMMKIEKKRENEAFEMNMTINRSIDGKDKKKEEEEEEEGEEDDETWEQEPKNVCYMKTTYTLEKKPEEKAKIIEGEKAKIIEGEKKPEEKPKIIEEEKKE